MCCAFNAESALKKTTYSDLVRTMQGKTSPKKDFKEEVRKVKTGSKNGLTIWLDQHSDKTSFGTVYDDYNGFKVNAANEDLRSQQNPILSIYILITSTFVRYSLVNLLSFQL